MSEFLLPRTDAGVAVQIVVALVVYATAGWAARENREVRTFVLGLATFTGAWFALRTVH